MGSTFLAETRKAMAMLAADPRVIFLGQQVAYSGHAVFESLQDVPAERRLEVPVFEDTQTGMATGLALAGFLPVSIYPRLDFLVLGLNQLVNHLDKLPLMSCGQFTPKVILRTMVGGTKPLDPGPQHSQDHIEALRLMLKTVTVVMVSEAEMVVPLYRQALEFPGSVLMIEAPGRGKNGSS